MNSTLLNVKEDLTMKRSITRWTTTLAASALLALPVAATAATQQPYSPPPQQQPAPQPAQPQQPAPKPTEPQPAQPQPDQPQPAQPQPQPAQPQPTEPQPNQPAAPPATATQQPPASATQPSAPTESPEEHLRQARAAFNDIKMTSIPARDRTEFAELRRHLAALENPSAAAASSRSPRSKGAADSANNWGTEVAAIDRLITQLSGSDTAKATPGATTTGATGTAGTSAKGAASSVSIDEATRAKLMEIRTHITAYAAAKSGAPSSPRTEAMANETMTSTAQSGNATAGETPRTGNYATEGQSATTPPQSNNAAPQGAAVAPKVDTEAAHRSLLAARDALNQLTQLPAAAQLTGDARTQVQQLITNFNELITNSTDWRASYTKVSATLTTLLGADNTDAQATAAAQTPTAPTPTTGAAGTTGAVGTSGTATIQLDPAIRAKLVDMRNSLVEFEKASGGATK